MVRQLAPPHLKTAGPTSAPPQRYVHPDTVVVNHYAGTNKLIPAVPGFRTSAAFLTSLSANLRITDDDLMPSPLGTPNSLRGHNPAYPLPPPSPLSFSTVSAHNPYPSPAETEFDYSSKPSMAEPSSVPSTAGLPELATYTAQTEDDREDGLRLVADSVAQQRQLASKVLIFHPVNLAVFLGVLAIIARYFYLKEKDLLVLATTIGGLTMTALILVRYFSGGYVFLAEKIGFDWLGDDRLIVVKWGQEVIGALVLGWAEDGTRRKGGRGKRRGRAVIRAWTVKLRYRRKGIGESLLEEAVKVAGEWGADGIDFAQDHALSKRLLPHLYNAFLDERDKRAEVALDKVVDQKGRFGKRR